MLLWSAFVLCVLAQIIVLSVVNAQFKFRESEGMGSTITPGEEVWFMFIPSMLFGVLCDIEILIQTWFYKPIAFKATPRFCREILFIIGCLSFVMSVVLILFSFLAFTPAISPTQFLKWFFWCLMMKAVCWSPIIAIEYYDTVFENIYFDVQFQLNPIKPKKIPKPVQIRIDDDSDDEYAT